MHVNQMIDRIVMALHKRRAHGMHGKAASKSQPGQPQMYTRIHIQDLSKCKCIEYALTYWSIVAQDGPGPSRTDTVQDVKIQFFQDGSGRGCPQNIGGLHFMVRDAVVAPYLHLH